MAEVAGFIAAEGEGQGPGFSVSLVVTVYGASRHDTMLPYGEAHLVTQQSQSDQDPAP